MLDPSFFINSDDVRRYLGFMIEPCPSEKPKATLANWSISFSENGALRMRGIIFGHPKFERVGLITGPIWQLNIEKRLMRVEECWFTIDRGYHEGVPADVEMEAVGPHGHFIAPCVAERYLQIIRELFQHELH